MVTLEDLEKLPGYGRLLELDGKLGVRKFFNSVKNYSLSHAEYLMNQRIRHVEKELEDLKRSERKELFPSGGGDYQEDDPFRLKRNR